MSKRPRRGGGAEWVSGGELGVMGGSSHHGLAPGPLKGAIVEILLEHETVTKALKRLRPAPAASRGARPRNAKEREALKSKKAADALLEEMAGPEAQERAQRDKRDFEALTEAADELMDMGFEDIYVQTREQIVATMEGGFKELQGRSMFVWHDDGAVPEEQREKHPMYRQDRSADVLTFNRDLDRGGVAVPPPSQGRGGSVTSASEHLSGAHQEVLNRLAAAKQPPPSEEAPAADPADRSAPSTSAAPDIAASPKVAASPYGAASPNGAAALPAQAQQADVYADQHPSADASALPAPDARQPSAAYSVPHADPGVSASAPVSSGPAGVRAGDATPVGGGRQGYDPTHVGSHQSYDPTHVGSHPSYDPTHVGSHQSYDPAVAGPSQAYGASSNANMEGGDAYAQQTAHGGGQYSAAPGVSYPAVPPYQEGHYPPGLYYEGGHYPPAPYYEGGHYPPGPYYPRGPPAGYPGHYAGYPGYTPGPPGSAGYGAPQQYYGGYPGYPHPSQGPPHGPQPGTTQNGHAPQ